MKDWSRQQELRGNEVEEAQEIKQKMEKQPVKRYFKKTSESIKEEKERQ